MDIPREYFLRQIIDTFGIIFFLTHDKFPEKRHPTIVVGMDIEKNTVLLVVGTSKIEKTKRHINLNSFKRETLIITGPRECKSLLLPTAFNCNQVVELSLEDLCTKIEGNDVKRLDIIDISTMNKILKGIQLSTMIDPLIKELVEEYFRSNKE